MSIPIYITGSGLVTSAGRSVESTFDAICDGAFLRDHKVLSTRAPAVHPGLRALSTVTPQAGSEVPRRPGFDRAETRAFGVPQTRLAGVSKVASLGFEAGAQAIDQAGWTVEHLSDADTALIVCTSKGPVLDWLPTPAIPRGLFGLGSVDTELAELTGVRSGPRLLASAACASGLHGIARAAMMLRSGQVRRALVIATEASVHPLFLGSFNRLGVLCDPGEICRPFDQRRSGFFIADAAAAVCLQLDRPAGNAVSIDRIAIAGDATHLTGSDPDGAVLRHVIRSVVGNAPIDFVHAHGTGTVLNDRIELGAIDAVVTAPVPVVSHKSALGHTLGASSLVSLVLAAQSHRRGVALPNVFSDQPIPARHVIVAGTPLPGSFHRSLITAAGFGGAVAAATLVCSSG